MAIRLDGIQLTSLSDRGDVQQKSEQSFALEVATENDVPIVRIHSVSSLRQENASGGLQVPSLALEYTVTDHSRWDTYRSHQILTFSLGELGERVKVCPAGKSAFMVHVNGNSFIIHFQTEFEMTRFQNVVESAQQHIHRKEKSVFEERTDEASATQYFQFYGYLSQQQNMMQDYIRTSTYQKAMLQNHEDFRNKVVLDVGAGSCILSFFAIQAGASKVYAVEASSIAQQAEQLVKANRLVDRIVVIPKKIEELTLPEEVDIIISEPMGYMLFNERMLESYMHARKWLKPGGKMFPSIGDLHVAPFTDDSLYMEQFNKANFWYQQSFHGVNLTSLREAALQEFLRQPIVDTFDIRICLARSVKYTVNFGVAAETDLHRIEIPLSYTTHQAGAIHGLAFWFDVAFHGSIIGGLETGLEVNVCGPAQYHLKGTYPRQLQTVWLSTSPTQPLTHWYQVRCLLRSPLYVKHGQKLTGKVVLIANKRQSYDIDIELECPRSGVRSTNRLDLKNPFFHYSGQPVQPPSGSYSTSPSESYWNQYSSNGMESGGSIHNGYSTQDMASLSQSTNVVPMANSDPISHTSVLPGGSAQHQYFMQVPSSVGVVTSSFQSTTYHQGGMGKQRNRSNGGGGGGGSGSHYQGSGYNHSGGMTYQQNRESSQMQNNRHGIRALLS
ncbi:Histone-arginine methyltransferase CARM1 [Holothuria leucospilota]|uniref:type I protein arginine methyltransferase n=1 Tax=Holothuria leucospilota TaxID=206669 RepID=A0A9Q1C9I0_HOLLE|nr:Histone-arginine methyltransferase CARM1 [Holothuria leucospilota]